MVIFSHRKNVKGKDEIYWGIWYNEIDKHSILEKRKGVIQVAYLNEEIKRGKKGVNYITTLIDECMCNFHSIQQENDVGIDGQIELFDESHLPTGKLISVQVKTGKSYYDLGKAECYIPVGTHREYWMKMEMPVIGIVCIMDERNESVNTAFWVDIKEYLMTNSTAVTVKFKMSMHNEFSKEKFRKYFYNLVCKQLPRIEFQEAMLLLDGDVSDKLMAINILETYFSYEVTTWEKLMELYDDRDTDIDYSNFFEAISYAYSHPDHWITKGVHEFSEASKEYVYNRVKQFSEEDIVRILSIVENYYFDRGTLGQTAEEIVKNIMGSESKLLNIVLNSDINADIRFDAEIILAYQSKDFYLQHIDSIASMGNECTELVVKFIEDFGKFEIY